MNSRVHPKCKTKFKVTNWADYDRALVQRGDITVWISEDAIASWKPEPTGRRGAQRKFSDHAIETALALRLVFKLPLRQAEGFLRSVLSLMAVEVEAPDHTTMSRRSQHLDIQLDLDQRDVALVELDVFASPLVWAGHPTRRVSSHLTYPMVRRV